MPKQGVSAHPPPRGHCVCVCVSLCVTPSLHVAPPCCCVASVCICHVQTFSRVCRLVTFPCNSHTHAHTVVRLAPLVRWASKKTGAKPAAAPAKKDEVRVVPCPTSGSCSLALRSPHVCMDLAFLLLTRANPSQNEKRSCARLAPTSLDPCAATLDHRLCCSWRTVPSMPCTRVHAAHLPRPHLWLFSLVALLFGARALCSATFTFCLRQANLSPVSLPHPPHPTHSHAPNVQAKAQPAGDKAKTTPAAGSECFPLFVIQSLPFCSSFVQVAHANCCSKSCCGALGGSYVVTCSS